MLRSLSVQRFSGNATCCEDTVAVTLLKTCASAGCVGGQQCVGGGVKKPEGAEGPKACRCQPFVTVLHSASPAELRLLQT